MDKDRMKGKIDEVAGRAKRQVGEWTGDVQSQDEGMGEEIKGRVQNAWGKVKDKARDVKNDVKHSDRHMDRKRDVA